MKLFIKALCDAIVLEVVQIIVINVHNNVILSIICIGRPKLDMYIHAKKTQCIFLNDFGLLRRENLYHLSCIQFFMF